ncbi:hypothetical protein Glove_151g119 [Diversispora epigaea]|uniref:Protein kinase domain-containing protein n=1 Tax=Diversispora epigaea TaxID=1348612 RepID=A0A397J2T5_9GLOM|nr:hypothetical protein Glove_151g119 [Diversispora epigaea]
MGMKILWWIDNNEYGKCEDCQQDNTGQQWCNICNSIRFQSEFNKWTSEDIEINEFIQQTQFKATNYEEVIEWIPFDRFDNIEYLAQGGFGKVFKATWSDGFIQHWDYEKNNWRRDGNQGICLKSLYTSTCKNKFLQEIKNQLKFRGPWAIAMYGITKNPTENEYMMVMQYAKYGSLRKMLNTKFKILSWKQKITILFYIALGLAKIHETGLMHKDFHSGNIVNENIVSPYITDFGLCRPVSQNDNETIYGVISYMAPETLNKGEYTQASDVYSFGMIMLEVFTSYPPYYNIPHDEKLVFLICDGHKPEIIYEIPQLLKDLMEKCWNTDPFNRPTAKELEFQLKLYSDEYICNSSYKKSEIYKQTNKASKANKLNKNFIQYDPKITHPQAIYTSRHLSFLKFKTIIHDTKQWDFKIPEDIISINSSREEVKPKTFWNMCHGHVGTIVVAKVAGTDEISYNLLAFYCEFMMKSKVSDFAQNNQCWCYYDSNAYYEKPRSENKQKIFILNFTLNLFFSISLLMIFF